MSRIVVTTWGSLGDLNPYLAIAHGLHRRGHDVVVATCPYHRRTVENSGLRFHPVRPDCDWLQDAEKLHRYSHPRLGLLRVGKELLMPGLRNAYADLSEAVKGADLLVAMTACYAARLVAETKRIPWASAVHIPLGFFSAFDPSILEFSPRLSKHLRCLGPFFWRPFLGLSKRLSRPLAAEWYMLRQELGLPRACEGNPLSDSHSPLLVLALFSRFLAEQQPDWPSQSVVTGQPLAGTADDSGLLPDLQRFLDNGPPPIVFTLGSAICGNGGDFFEQSVASARQLNHRAVFVVGSGRSKQLAQLTPDMIAVEYASYQKLFPQAAVVVHHGGVGTTGIAMRTGTPMLVVPFAWDQPDNAERVRRLGIAEWLPRRDYSVHSATKLLRRLIADPAYKLRASTVAEQVRQEDGVRNACDALEALPAARR
ncbi:MAG: glycosyltransferase family 1 protein [Planctomycetaceae bacterium]|nr:glycosyltransferase family 1 protein [Planctomycetaceae bacterium]